MHWELNPDGYKAVYRQYDVDRGYSEQLVSARRHFQRRDILRDTDLTTTGVVKRPVFDAGQCADIIGRMKAVGEYDRDLAAEVLGNIFETDLAADIASYFQSEFVPIGAGFYDTPPDIPDDVSDGWHCDRGPSRHLIIMAYFTASEPDGANTLFATREITDRLKTAGYVYCQLRHRQVDLDRVTDALGLERAPVTALDIAAGEVIVFDAPNLLHRRLIPKQDHRWTMTAAVIPALQPWNEILARSAFPLPLGGETFPALPGYAKP